MTDRSVIEVLVQQEKLEANAKYPKFASDHEAYAVLLEEIDEAADELRAIKDMAALLWAYIKQDETKLDGNLKQIKHYAKNLAAEAVQIAAVCDKAVVSRAVRK